jgi:hypothetical protein
MPTQVYVVARRKEIQNGSVMITDLFPNKSQLNPTIDPQGQSPLYIKTPIIGKAVTLVTPVAGTVKFRLKAQGLVPFLIKNVEHGGGGSLSLKEASDASDAIIDAVRAGGVLNEVAINGILAAASGNGATTLDDGVGGSASVATVEDILRILSGETYEVAEGTSVEVANAFVPDLSHRLGFKKDQKHLVAGDDSWVISFREGSLKGLTSVQDAVNGDLFAGVRSTSPLLTVYVSDGTLFSL